MKRGGRSGSGAEFHQPRARPPPPGPRSLGRSRASPPATNGSAARRRRQARGGGRGGAGGGAGRLRAQHPDLGFPRRVGGSSRRLRCRPARLLLFLANRSQRRDCILWSSDSWDRAGRG